MKSVSIDAFARIRSLSGLRFSPEGSTACFVVSQGDMKKNAYRSELYTLRDGKPRRLTAGGREESFLFLDEDTVLFPAKREEDEKEKSLATVYYRISLSGGEAEPYLRFPIPVKELFPLKTEIFWCWVRSSRALRSCIGGTRHWKRNISSGSRRKPTTRS